MAVCSTQARNIIVGAARIWVAECTQSVPAFSANTSAVNAMESAGASWRELGFTTDGVEVTYQPDYGEVEVDQVKDAARLFNQGVNVMLNTTMVEATLQNLLVAWGQENSTLVTGGETADATFSIHVPGNDPSERKLVVVGPGPTRKITGVAPAPDQFLPTERVYIANRAVSMEGSNHNLRRTEATNFPVTFRLLPNADVTDAEYGTITDRLVQAPAA